MILGVCGFKDKRLILASLAGLFGEVGSTTLLTRNESFLLLSPNHELEFNIGSASSIIINGEWSEYIDMLYRETQFLILDIYAEIPDTLDLVLIADHRDYYIHALESAGVPIHSISVISMMSTKKFVGIPTEIIVNTVNDVEMLTLLAQSLLARAIVSSVVMPFKPMLSTVMGLGVLGEQLSTIESRINTLNARF